MARHPQYRRMTIAILLFWISAIHACCSAENFQCRGWAAPLSLLLLMRGTTHAKAATFFLFSKSTSSHRENVQLLASSQHSSASVMLASQPQDHGTASLQILEILRGGARRDVDDSDDDDDDDDDDSDVEEPSEEITASSNSRVRRVFGKVGQLLWKSTQATYRAVNAAFVKEDEDDGEAPSSMTAKFIKTIRRMWKAAFRDDAKSTLKMSSGKLKKANNQKDFGITLAKSYRVQAGRFHDDDDDDDGDHNNDYSPILTGSIIDALKQARMHARLLLVFIPAEKPSSKASAASAADVSALQSFLSKPVADVAESKARNQQPGADKLASFFLWSAKSGSPDAQFAIKRLKPQTSSTTGQRQKRPILLVAYLKPALDKQGTMRMVPRLLAQHHCSPPPSPETMAAWLNALRKRHVSQYAEMQTQLQEMEYARQRQEGYHESVQSDNAQLTKERRETAERQAKQAAEKKHQQAILARRQELTKELPKEAGPETPNVKTIALRLPDGQSAQRRFLPDTPLSQLFNWVDCAFELERENVILTTLNGQKSFSWQDDVVQDDSNLSDVGLGRMTGLRVTSQKKEDKPKGISKEPDEPLSASST